MSNNLRPDLTPPIDLSIHELSEIRGAILHCIDEGRLVKGKREPWSFYPPHPSNWIYEDQLPTTLSQSDYDAWYAQSEVIDGVRMGPNVIGDWHMDESGDCNEQRLDFCDEVATVLLKRIKGVTTWVLR